MGSVEWIEVSTVKQANFNWTLLTGHKIRAKTKLKPCMPPELG